MKFVLDFEIDADLTHVDTNERVRLILRNVINDIGNAIDTVGPVRDETGFRIGQWEMAE